MEKPQLEYIKHENPVEYTLVLDKWNILCLIVQNHPGSASDACIKR